MYDNLIDIHWKISDQRFQDLVIILDEVNFFEFLKEDIVLRNFKNHLSFYRQDLSHLFQCWLVDLTLPETQIAVD